MEVFGQCRLCLTEHIKLCELHIFPEFLYTNVYDTDDHFYNVYSSKVRPSRRRNGIYERLLCLACERRLGDLETYARKVLYVDIRTPGVMTSDCFIIENIDYNRFKLFLLSLLWRAGVSSRPEFEAVNLGEHERFIRELLHTQSPGGPLDYPVVLFIMRMGSKSVMAMPSKFRPVHGFNGFRATMLGLSWMFIIGRHQSFPAPHVIFNRQGHLPLVKDNGKGMDFLHHWVSQILD